MESISSKKRNISVDLIKFICAFGVICIHTKSSTSSADIIGNFFTPFCVPFFFLTSLIFFISGFRSGNMYSLSRKTFGRIMVPYLTWTLIYTILILIKHSLNHNNQSLVWWRILFFGEGAVQLYFLPKLLVLETLALSIALIVNSSRKLKLIGFALMIIPACYYLVGINYHCFGLGKDEFITTGIYLVLAFIISKYYKIIEVNPYFSVVGFILLVIAATLFYTGSTIHISNYSFNYVICSLSIVFVSISLPCKIIPNWLATILSLSYGIYLSHEVFIQGIEMLLTFSHLAIIYTSIIKIVFAIMVLLLSVSFTIIIRRHQLLKTFFLGN